MVLLEKYSVELQIRDVALLCGLFESRVMTARHVTALYFDGKREYAKKRLQKIKAAGLVAERKRRVNEPSVLFLTRKAFTLLKSDGHLDGYPPLSANSFEARASVRELTLRHELDVMDVKTAFHVALANSDRFSILEFCTWPLLCQFEASADENRPVVLVKPDGFIRLHEKEEAGRGFVHDLFLEVDRSSESQDILIARAACYRDFYRSGGFALRNGGAREDYEDFPFRVLIVMKTAERRNNTAERLLRHDAPILTQVWLTTMPEVIKDPLGPIWMRPAEYREATAGTPFDADRTTPTFIYRRNFERDQFVEAKVSKMRLTQNEDA
jgi:hypothetical protein